MTAPKMAPALMAALARRHDITPGDKGWQARLAEVTGLPSRHISTWVRGGGMTVGRMERLCAAHGLSAEYVPVLGWRFLREDGRNNPGIWRRVAHRAIGVTPAVAAYDHAKAGDDGSLDEVVWRAVNDHVRGVGVDHGG